MYNMVGNNMVTVCVEDNLGSSFRKSGTKFRMATINFSQIVCFNVFETGFCCISQSTLKFITILLLQHFKC